MSRLLSAGLIAGICLLLPACRSLEKLTPSVERRVSTFDPSAMARQPAGGRPYVMPRSQMKYGLFQNYLHWWNDRPLFHDRTLRYPIGTFQHIDRESFRRDAVEALEYRIDGFASIVNVPGHFVMHGQADGWLRAEPLPGFMLLIEWAGGSAVPPPSMVDLAGKSLQRALESPLSLRIDGKVVVTSYHMSWPPDVLQQTLASMPGKHGETCQFLPDVPIDVYGLMLQFHQGGVPAEVTAALRQKLREYAQASGGLMFAASNHMRTPDSPRYDAPPSLTFYRDYLIPLFVEVLAEPGNQGKWLALSAGNAYVNPRSGVNQSMDCTRTLRSQFEAAAMAGPEIILMPEWNEFNENTCLMPTVAGARTTQRIMRHYLQRLRGEPLSPLPGDAVDRPNLILSYRRTLKLGEVLDVELLDVPDGSTGSGQARLLLEDAQGRRLYTSDWVSYGGGNQIVEQRWSFPSERFAAERAICPALELRAAGQTTVWRGFRYVQIQPTICVDYVAARQPLRDLLVPEKADLIRQDAAALRGSIVSPEPLAAVELLADGDELAAADRNDEFGLERNLVLQCTVQSPGTEVLKGLLKVTGVDSCQLRPVEWANSDFTGWKETAAGFELNQRMNLNYRAFYLVLPRAQAAGATIEFSTTPGPATFRVSDILRDGAAAISCEGRGFIRVNLMRSLPDIPAPLNALTAEIDAPRLNNPHGDLYCLRAITMSGKVYHGRPLVDLLPDTWRRQQLPVWSDHARGPVTVAVDGSRVPDVAYRFEPLAQDLLTTPAGPAWAGELGGGINYGEPMNRGDSLPDDVTDASPAWELLDGRWCLRFDGRGQYVTFPTEAIPRGSFTLSMEILPTGLETPRVLFRHFGMVVGSFTLSIEKGELVCTWVDRKLETHRFETGLALPADAWSTVTVRYDLEELLFAVNGQRRAYPFGKLPLYFQPGIFGGNTRGEFGVTAEHRHFAGYLRAIRLTHYPLPLP